MKRRIPLSYGWSFSKSGAVCGWLLGFVLLLSALCSVAGELSTGSLGPYVHRISLYDEDGAVISPDDIAINPWSPRRTCGKCHDYDAISSGWHFNAIVEGTESGRPGEPWLWVDETTGTQLPLSYRSWHGTWQPDSLGLTYWQMVQRFGRHMNGGGAGEPKGTLESLVQSSEERWPVSGKLEIDCMTCHSMSLRYDQTERQKQIEDMNYKWVPTATQDFALVRGKASDLPDDFDPIFNFDNPDMPQIIFSEQAFDDDDRVYFDITRNSREEQCFFCHTSLQEEAMGAGRWQHDGDVHLNSGLSCVDCHRHGIDHQVTRGYEVGADVPAEEASLSCAGCHYGTEDRGLVEGALSRGGRLGAPDHQHPGLPPLHFDVLTCTACHSGPWPQGETHALKTSLAHGLGIASENRTADDLPHIEAPVFLKDEAGKLAPFKLVWPAFWGTMQDDEIKPLTIDKIEKQLNRIVKQAMPESAEAAPARVLLADESVITEVLKQLKASVVAEDAKPVRVVGGRVAVLNDQGTLQWIEHRAADYYAWPIGHDVRPAGQALGAKGCAECHSSEGSVFHSQLRVSSLAAGLPGFEPAKMYDLTGESPTLLNLWERSFAFRDQFKVLIMIVLVALALALMSAGTVMTMRIAHKNKKGSK